MYEEILEELRQLRRQMDWMQKAMIQMWGNPEQKVEAPKQEVEVPLVTN